LNTPKFLPKVTQTVKYICAQKVIEARVGLFQGK